MTFQRYFLLTSLILATSIWTNAQKDVGNFEKAKHFYELGEYIESIELLDASTEEDIVLMWRNEIEIGCKFKDRPNKQVYLEYIKNNPKLFLYYEPDGVYLVTEDRLKLLKRMNPESVYLEEMEYFYIEQKYMMAGEYSDDYYQTALEFKEILENFLKKYPDTKYRNKILGRIERFRNMRPATEDCEFVVNGVCVD
jgi:hypothetical protein